MALTAGPSAPPRSCPQLRLQSTVGLAKATNRRQGKDAEQEPGSETTALQVVSSFREVSHIYRSLSHSAGLGLAAFLGRGERGQELRTDALGFLATLLTPMASGGLAASGGATMAFCPMCPVGPDVSKCMPLRELTMKELETGVLCATFVQGSLGILRMCLGDVFSGAYGLLLATLGYNSRKPGPASNWLKTYVLITFINGTMSGIDVIQQTLLGNSLLILPGVLPLSVNCAHLVTLTVPLASFLGAYCGWNHIKNQRKAAVQAYQDQMMMLMEQPPWPPPPLPFPLPGMPGFQVVEDPQQMPRPSGGPTRLAPVQEQDEEEEN